MLPRRTTTSRDAAVHRLTSRGKEADTTVVLDSTNTDAGNTPATRFRPGNVVILRTSTGRYVEADDTNADAMLPATVSAAETADTDWQSATITLALNGGPGHTVTLGAADDTDAEVVTALNGDAGFAALYIADESGGVVRIRTRQAGEGLNLLVTSSLATAYGASGTEGLGSDPAVGVTEHVVDLVDENNVAINEMVTISRVNADYDTSQLISLTNEARIVLERNGCTFD